VILNNKKMKNKNRPYIIGETAYHFEGDFDYMIRMVNDMANLEVDAIKYHLLLNPSSYCQYKHPIKHLYEKWKFSEKQWKDIIDLSESKGMDVVALCDDIESIRFIIKEYPDLFAVELHATSLNDYYLLHELLNYKGKIVLGIGGSTLNEIQFAIDFLRSHGKHDILLMYGFQSYPTKYFELNLSRIPKLEAIFNLPVGYADHTGFDDPNNELISSMAAMMGVNILEKHYTPDFGKERIDYHAAVGKEHFIKIKELMNLALTVYGNGSFSFSDSELAYGNVGPMKKAIVARTDILKGEKLSEDNLWFKRTKEQSPIQQSQFIQLLGLEVIEDISADEVISFKKVNYTYNEFSSKDFGTEKEDAE
jgi:N,N'-diacetyllegionaminate synthase